MDAEHERRDGAWRVPPAEQANDAPRDRERNRDFSDDREALDREALERRLRDEQKGEERPNPGSNGGDSDSVRLRSEGAGPAHDSTNGERPSATYSDTGYDAADGLDTIAPSGPGFFSSDETRGEPARLHRIPEDEERHSPELSLDHEPRPSNSSQPDDPLFVLTETESQGNGVSPPDQPTPTHAPEESTDDAADEGVHGASDTAQTRTAAKKKAPESDYIGPRIDRVVRHLLKNEIVRQEQVELAKETHMVESSREALWRTLARISGVNRDAVFSEAARVYAFPTAQIGDGTPDHDFVRLVMETFEEGRRDELLRLIVLPIEYQVEPTSGAAKLIFATHDPARPEVNRILQELKLGRIELQYAPEMMVRQLIADIFPKQNEYLQRISDDPFAVDIGASYEEEGELVDRDALEAEISRSQLINLVEATLVEATRQGASDIHIFPNPHRQIEIHFRVDGRLKLWHREERIPPEAFLAVVKDNAMNVDRFDSDTAQDGFIQRRIDDALIRFRVSVLPIATASQETRAESVVIRVLDDRKVLSDLTKLGMLDVALKRFYKAIRMPHGMVILTGPTGSGKSTTLVAALHQVVTPDVNVLTVEDPVEYIIKGVRQIKLSHKLGLEQALRSILRHDPDVVMVGEMRDRETAELAIKLANTGHLTFSTLHTNDAPSAVSRLYKMGIEPFLIAYAINLVVAQRLIRNLCPDCKTEDRDIDKVMLEELGFTKQEIEETTFYKPGTDSKCRRCNGNHYSGRRAMCEALFFSREIRHMIVQSGEAIDEDMIRKQAVKDGMLTLLDSAREVVRMGETSIEELLRTTAAE
jgi:type IV pilus assembly protein PilB